MLPTFIIAGERRSGTTSLYYWMDRHPNVYLFPDSDTGFFLDLKSLTGPSTNFKSADWEKSHFVNQYSKRFTPDKEYSAIGEKCAEILFWQDAQERLSRYVPNCKLIISLRNPVSRAWSDYLMEVRKGRETLSFQEALENEDKRTQLGDFEKYHFSYRRRGFYDENLQALYKYFSPSQVLVLIFEETVKQPVETLKTIYKFLNVDSDLGLENAGKQFNKKYFAIERDWVKRLKASKFEAILINKLFRTLEYMLKIDKNRGRARIYRERIQMYVQSLFQKETKPIIMPEESILMLKKAFSPHIDILEKMLDRKINEWR
jgi:hypothetical protein